MCVTQQGKRELEGEKGKNYMTRKPLQKVEREKVKQRGERLRRETK
jgi:hypothetical protein